MAEQTFTSGQILTAAQMTTLQTNTGLCYVSSTTIGTTVSSVTVSSCFSTTYDNYRIVIGGGVTSTGTNMNFQLTGITGSVYNTAGVFVSFGSATVTGSGGAAATTAIYAPGDANVHAASFDITSPFLAVKKGLISNGVSGSSMYTFSSYINSTTSSTGFTISPATGTITGGTIIVYGYRK
jgi:hypothetical protein